MNSNKRICVIFTGGTIGSSHQNGMVGTDKNSRAQLIEGYRKIARSEIVFDALHPVELLSENMLASDLDKIADCVRGVDKNKYDGIIVTHGTDTLCFTANYFSLLFCNFPLPVVFVSALYPLADPRTNGFANFAGAVNFISTVDFGGVFVSFKNPNEPCKIHLASRLISAAQFIGVYDSIAACHFATVESTVTYNDTPLSPCLSELRNNSRTPIRQGLCPDIVFIRARALLDFTYYNFERHKPRAVVIELYHSGTVCTVGDATSFLQFRDYCLGLGIHVVITPLVGHANVYESALSITDGCVTAYDTSAEMTTVKVMSALALGEDVQSFLDKNIFYEKLTAL